MPEHNIFERTPPYQHIDRSDALMQYQCVEQALPGTLEQTSIQTGDYDELPPAHALPK
ncbi:hypothetical protein ACIBCN_41420 [Nocardia sp. NPDC051052]|uniref:hypothetical protein n=1 Tax=Nocardia sp. NPDC051052 TaxID=3364322 RepID=UPI003793FE45